MNLLRQALRAAASTSWVRRAAYPIADRALESYGAWRMRGYDVSNTVALVSTGRGGSTWLAELVTSLPNRIMIWEPLHLGNNPSVRDLGVGWNTYLGPEAEAPELEAYLDRLITGRALNTRTLTSLNFSARSLLQPEGIVVKFVQVHLMLPWFVERFPAVPVVGLVRHPCAVVASQLRHGAGWATLTKEKLDVDPALFDDHPHIAETFESIETTVQALAFAWGIKTWALLRTRRRLLVAYEALLADPAAEAERIFDYIGVTPPPSVVERVRRPSATTNDSVSYDGWRDRLTSWQRTLPPDDQDRVLKMAHDLGVTCYGRDPWPDLQGALPHGRP